ncbi:distal tail protein Dit, partial [Escherichia coli]|uniref:distal tail protein Dit n=1 Tax=Escherichia coli TaxID=562 RepID=UPI003CF2A810
MIKFAGKRIPDFVKVNKIGFSILPSIETKTLKVQGRAGVLDYGTEFGERKINADITLIVPKANEVLKYSTILAEWLFHTELQELILDDEPDKKYMARIEGETPIDEMLRTGTGTLTFTCPSPFKEALKPKVFEVEGISDIDPAVNGITIEGSADTYPIIELKANEDMPAIVLKNGDDKFFQVGEDISDVVEAMPDREILIDDDASTLSGWTSPIKTDGVVSGEIVSDGRQFLVKDGNFGSA